MILRNEEKKTDVLRWLQTGKISRNALKMQTNKKYFFVDKFLLQYVVWHWDGKQRNSYLKMIILAFVVEKKLSFFC